MLKKIAVLSFVLLLISFSVTVWAAPPLPARIGGTVTVDGIQLTQGTDTGYTFKVTKQDGTAYNPTAEDTDGLNSSNWYVIDIPIYEASDQPGGANPGDTAVVHIYKDGNELSVISPTDRQFTVGQSGSTDQIDLVANINTIAPTLLLLLLGD